MCACVRACVRVLFFYAWRSVCAMRGRTRSLDTRGSLCVAVDRLSQLHHAVLR